MSALAREPWIEIAWHLRWYFANPSALAREPWIEIIRKPSLIRYSLSALAREPWIEICFSASDNNIVDVGSRKRAVD